MRQVTKDKAIVKIATEKELKFNLIKKVAIDRINKDIEEEKIFRKIVMDLMPEFNKLVTLYEFRWGKSRSEFTLLEKEKVSKEFEEKHIDKL